MLYYVPFPFLYTMYVCVVFRVIIIIIMFPFLNTQTPMSVKRDSLATLMLLVPTLTVAITVAAILVTLAMEQTVQVRLGLEAVL